MTKSFWDHPIETIEKALHLRKQIEALEKSLGEIFGDGSQPLVKEKAVGVVKDGRKGKRSAATRAKMKAAQQARWAKKKSSLSPVKAARAKRTMSAASRKRMSAGQRARRTKEKIAPELSMPNNLVF
jgi:hypothetical protein